MRAKYICFEGIDGAGKSLQIETLANKLNRTGVTPILLTEPSYGPYGKEVRARMATGTIGDLKQQRHLFTQDRIDHVNRKIKPLLEFVRSHSNFIILQSRSYLSSPAYQCDSLDRSVLASFAAAEKTHAPEADIILLLDLPADQALLRLTSERLPDSFETLERLEKVSLRYRHLAQITPNCAVVDAAGEASTVAARVYRVIEEFEGGSAP